MLGVLLGGRASFEVGEKRFEKVGGRPNVFSGKPHSVYIPAKSKFTITADSPVEIALPSAPSDLEAEPYVIEPSKVANGVWGAANFGSTVFNGKEQKFTTDTLSGTGKRR